MLLPKPPSLEEIQAHIPNIGPVHEATDRPFWSVMIPTYNSGEYLRRTLESVLCQALGPDEMQIEVVDGCSTRDDPEPVLEELGKGRVTFFRLPSNRGPAHTFNKCIERSRGHWVHILHGDDTVNEDFYKSYRRACESVHDAAIVHSRHYEIDDQDRITRTSRTANTARQSFVVTDFSNEQALVNQCCFPTVVVKRDVYERVGGFCEFFQHYNDMDMWFRASLAGSAIFVNRVAANYRLHPGQDSARCHRDAINIRELALLTPLNLERLAQLKYDVSTLRTIWRKKLARWASYYAYQLDDAGEFRGRVRHALWSFRLDPTPHRGIFVAKSVAKQYIQRFLEYRPRGVGNCEPHR